MQRIHYLDNLRSLAMLAGVYLHAAFAYARPAQSLWLATDPGSSVAIDASIWLIHLFRMSLFFLLSGYFAALVTVRKGTLGFLRSRLLRIGIPLILFYPVLLIATTATIVFAVKYLEHPQGLMKLIAEGSEGQRAESDQNALTTMHLWFLYYLLMFSLLTPWLERIPFLQRVTPGQWLVFLCIMPLAILPGVFGSGAPLPAPESFWPTWWPLVFYGCFYLLGWLLHGRESALAAIDPHCRALAIVCGLLFIVYYWMMPKLDLNLLIAAPATALDWRTVCVYLLTAGLSVSLTILALVLGQRYLSFRSGWMSFMADASYWVYLMHLPVVLFLQTLLVPLAWSIYIKLGLVIFGTMLSCMATYIVFVRYTPVGWLLHGRRSFP